MNGRRMPCLIPLYGLMLFIYTRWWRRAGQCRPTGATVTGVWVLSEVLGHIIYAVGELFDVTGVDRREHAYAELVTT